MAPHEFRMLALEYSPVNCFVDIYRVEKYCNFGSTLTSGDLNADGFHDLVVGSHFAPGTNGEQRGTVTVLYSDPQREALNRIVRGKAASEWFYAGSQNYDWTGFSLDVYESSGLTWLAVGAPTHRICTHDDCRYDSSDLQSVGKVLLFRTPLGEQPLQTLIGQENFGQFGFSVKFGKHHNQDVLAIGAVTAVGEVGSANNLTQAGEVFVFNVSLEEVSGQPWLRFHGDRSFGRFGSSVLLMNVNDRDAIVISAALRSETMLQDREGGKVFVYFSDAATHHAVEMSEADKVLSLGEEKSRFGSVLSQHENQLIVSAPLSNAKARMSGQLGFFNL